MNHTQTERAQAHESLAAAALAKAEANAKAGNHAEADRYRWLAEDFSRLADKVRGQS